MLDIESTSTHPSMAGIVSVAAIKFRMEGPAPVYDKAGALYVPFDLRHQFMLGRVFDNQKWWTGPGMEEARSMAQSGIPLGTHQALTAIGEFISDPAMPVWANGSVFDVGNVESVYYQAARVPPWRYNSPRDARTVYSVCPKRRTMPEMDGVRHDPIWDCEYQIWKLWERWPFS